jgi:hypothetical protein
LKASIIVIIKDRVLFNLFNQNEIWMDYEKDTTIGCLINNLPNELFEGINLNINDFNEVKNNRLLVT